MGSSTDREQNTVQLKCLSTDCCYPELYGRAELEPGLRSQPPSQTLTAPTGCELAWPLGHLLSSGACSSSSTAQTYTSTKSGTDSSETPTPLWNPSYLKDSTDVTR